MDLDEARAVIANRGNPRGLRDAAELVVRELDAARARLAELEGACKRIRTFAEHAESERAAALTENLGLIAAQANRVAELEAVEQRAQEMARHDPGFGGRVAEYILDGQDPTGAQA